LKDWNKHVTLPSSQLHVTTLFILTFSPFLKLLSLSHSSSHATLFLSTIKSVVVHSQEVPMLHFVYCKSKGKF
jgi:hypothetical protein